jgi:hypothetical protein
MAQYERALLRCEIGLGDTSKVCQGTDFFHVDTDVVFEGQGHQNQRTRMRHIEYRRNPCATLNQERLAERVLIKPDLLGLPSQIPAQNVSSDSVSKYVAQAVLR